MATKEHILSEIKRTAANNGGVPLGSRKFETETGVRTYDWLGRFWARWSDALDEAGFCPNKLQGAYDTRELLERYIALARELGRLPTANDLRLKDRADETFPSSKVFERFGAKSELVKNVLDYSRQCTGVDDVVAMCEAYVPRAQAVPESPGAAKEISGYVYLIQHGQRREYKIGRTNNVLRREGKIGIELPERVQPIHVIETDDAAGIEAYWHRRFTEKRKRHRLIFQYRFDGKSFPHATLVCGNLARRRISGDAYRHGLTSNHQALIAVGFLKKTLHAIEIDNCIAKHLMSFYLNIAEMGPAKIKISIHSITSTLAGEPKTQIARS